MKNLFRNKDYTLLFFGSLVSSIGTVLFSFCLGLYIQDIFSKDIYHGEGAFYFSIVLGISIFAKVVFSPIAGALIDRWNKVKILYLSDLIRGILFFLVFYVLDHIESDFGILYLFIIVSFFSGLFQAMFTPASSSLLPDVVGENNLQKAVGVNSIIGSVKTLFGVLLGMVLYELVGIKTAILVNAVSFFFSGISELFIHPKYKQVIHSIKQTIRRDIKDGLLYLKEHQGLLHLLIFSVLLNFAFSPLFSVCIPYLFYTELGKNAYHLGSINVVIAMTTLIVGPIVGLQVFRDIKKVITISFVSIFISYLLIGIWISLYQHIFSIYWVFYIIFLLITVALTISLIVTNIPVNTNIVKSIDTSIRGRVLSIVSAFSGLSVPVSYLIAGKLIETTNVSTTVLLFGGFLVIPVFGFLTDKHVKQFVGDFT